MCTTIIKSDDALATVTPMLRTSAGRRGSDIEIGAEVERYADREAAVAIGVRRHVEHVLDAVDLLFDWRHHGRRDHLGARAGILTRNVDDRRRDFRILRDRQAREGDRAEDHDHDRDDGRKDRPVDEEMRKPHVGRVLCG
jgi:hypothetical protein